MSTSVRVSTTRRVATGFVLLATSWIVALWCALILVVSMLGDRDAVDAEFSSTFRDRFWLPTVLVVFVTLTVGGPLLAVHWSRRPSFHVALVLLAIVGLGITMFWASVGLR